MTYNASEDKLEILYSESDGNPMSDNTLQFDWIVLIKSSLEVSFANRQDVFVAGDLLWYPVKGQPKIRIAPDVLVAIGRPKGYRGSYQQWKEGNIPPQVVFEILSPNNTAEEMRNKHAFYERYGVEEYYVYDPEDNVLEGYLRRGGKLAPITGISRWASPLLGIRFEWNADDLRLFHPNGSPFLSYVELSEEGQAAWREAAQQRRKAERAKRLAEAEKQRAEEQKQRADQHEQELHALKEKLRRMGIDPDAAE
jgi:Uma2 family endonuclease